MKATKLALALVVVAICQPGCKDNGQAPHEVVYGRWVGNWVNVDVILNLSISGEQVFGNGKVVTSRGLSFTERKIVEVRSAKENGGQLILNLIFEIPSRGEMIIGRFVTPARFEGEYTFDDGTGRPIILTKQND